MILKEKKSNIWPESRRRRKSIMHSEVRKKGRSTTWKGRHGYKPECDLEVVDTVVMSRLSS